MGKSKVTVTISSDTKGFTTGLKEAETGLSGFSSKLTSSGQSMVKFGGLMTLGLTAPIGFAAKQVFDAASNMQESMGKIGVVFGQASDEVVAWSKNSASSLGLSQQAALEAAGTYGNLFSAFGIGKKETKEMSTGLVGLAADLASFNNTSTDDALLALQSGLSGETEPLKKFGIALSDVRLKEEALSLGLIKSTKEALNPAAKAQASYSLIMKDSKLAQGDFARTSDGAANKQRILAAQFENVKTSLGQGLIPVATQLFGIFGDLLGAFNELSPKTKNFILIGAGIAAAIGPAITALGALTVGVGFLLTPIGLVALGIAGVAAGMVYLYNTSEPVRKAVDGLVESFKNFNLDDIAGSLKNIGSNLSTVVTEGLRGLTDAIANIDWAEVTGLLLDGLDQAKDAIFGFLSGIDWGGLVYEIGSLLATAFEGLGKLLTDIDWKKVFTFILELAGDLLILLAKIDWGAVAAGVGKALLGALKLVFIALPTGLIKLVVGLFSAVFELLPDVDWGEIAAKVGTGLLALFKLVFIDLPVKLWGVIWGGLKDAWNFIKDAADWGEIVATVGGALVGLFKLVFIDLPKKLWDLVWTGLKKVWDFIADVDWGEIAATVGEAYVKLFKLVWIDLPKKIGGLVITGIKAAFKWAVDKGGDLMSSLTEWLKKLPGKIVSAIGGLGKTLFNTGKDLIQGLLDGAGSLLTKIGTFFLDKVPSWIKTPFKKALGISSPSKVFADYGKNIVEGLTLGLDNMKPIDAAMRKISGSTSLTLAGASGGKTTVVNNYYQVDAQMLTPTPEVGRVIQQSLKQFQTLDGR